MKSLYAIDVGIGFTKRAYRQDVDSEVMIKSEASTLAPVPNHDESEDLTKVSFIDLDFAYYMGNEAHQSDASLLPPFDEEIEIIMKANGLNNKYLVALQRIIKKMSCYL